MQKCEQGNARSNQNHRVPDEDVHFHSEITFLRAKENVRSISPAIIALLHLGVRDQIRDLLIHIKLFGRDGAGGMFENRAVKWAIPVENLIDQAEITIEILGELRLQTREDCQCLL